MKNSLIAPQFGLLKSPAAKIERGSVSHHTDGQIFPQPAVAGFGPSIIVKRRRVPVAPSLGDGTVRLDSPRAAKVYRLERILLNESSELSQRAQIEEQPTAPTFPRRRRRVHPERRPATILLEVSDSLGTGEPQASPIETDSLACDWKQIREALKRLDRTLASIARGQTAFRALDELLCGLGIGRRGSSESSSPS